MEISLSVIVILSFLGVLVLTPVAIALSNRFGFVDAPDGEAGRKQHEKPVPPVGGIVMMSVFACALIVSGFDVLAYCGAFAALALVAVVGAIDDRFHISAKIKLAVQVIATLLLITYGGAHVTNLGDMFGLGEVILSGVWSWIFSFAAVLLLINAINLSDGLDGLAGGQSVVITLFLAVGALLSGQFDLLMICVMLLSVLIGFLAYNFRHPFRKSAALFMGDSGSMSLGVLIAFLAINVGMAGEGESFSFYSPMAIAWILAVPIMDACAQFIRRMSERRHPFDADRGHFHHLFVDSGVPVSMAVNAIVMLCILCGSLAFAAVYFNLSDVVLTALWGVVFVVYTLNSIRPKRLKSMLSKLK
jgi:UDP-GlcNAc:undecaprenyl-phosphate GlcNAc-1-phosphate transferase